MNKTLMIFATAALFALATSVFTSMILVHAQGPDFNVSSAPEGRCIRLGATASYSVTVSSLSGFAGSVMLDDNINPNTANGPTLSPIPSSVSITANSNATFDLTASTTSSTPTQVYSITIDGVSGDLVHTAYIYLAFQPLCSTAGGTVELVNTIGIIAPYTGIAITIVGISAAAAALLYIRRQKPE